MLFRSLAINEFKLPVKSILDTVKSEKFNCPGSILKVKYNNTNPIAYGMEKNGIGYFSRSLVFDIKKDSVKTDKKLEAKKTNAIEIVASYPDDPLLVSGWMIGDELIRRKAAILNVPVNKGNVILFGFNFHNRAQSYQTFKLLFNALL